MAEKPKSKFFIELYNHLLNKSDILLIAAGKKPRTLWLDLTSEQACRNERERVQTKITAAQAELKEAERIAQNERASLLSQGKEVPSPYPPETSKTFEDIEAAKARQALAQAEAKALEKLIEQKVSEAEQEQTRLQEKRATKPRGSGLVKNHKLVEIDHQPVSNTTGEPVISGGPYEGMKVSDYRSKIVMPYKRRRGQIEKRKSNGVSA